MSLTKLITPKNMTALRLLSWAKKGGFAILDQGLFASTNFLVNILLARWLPPEQYGAFAVAYSVFLLLAALHTAVLTEPMLVFGAGKYQGSFRKYLGFLLYAHWGLAILFSLILAVIALVFWRSGSEALAEALFSLAIAAPFILLPWLLRRAFYVRYQPQWAATGGGLYLGLMLAGMYGLYHEHWLSSFSALVVMGVASVAVGLWFMGILRPEWQLVGSNPTSYMIVEDHWAYARWAATASVTSWVSGNLQSFVLALASGLASAGIMRALDNILMPYWQFQAALSVILLPLFSRHSHKSRGSFATFVIKTILIFIVLATAFYIILNLLGEKFMSYLYRDMYLEYDNLLSWYAIILFPETVSAVLLVAFRALLMTKLVFLYHLILSIGLIGGFYITAKYGVLGIIYTRVVVSYILLLFFSIIYIRLSLKVGKALDN